MKIWRLAVRVYVPIYVRVVPTDKVLDNTSTMPRWKHTAQLENARLIPGNNTGNNNADLPSIASADPGTYRRIA